MSNNRYIPLLLFLLFFVSISYSQVRKSNKNSGGNESGSKGKYDFIAQKKAKVLKGGAPISLNVQSARISDLIRLFQEKTGLNIIASDKIAGSFTAHVKNIPARDALRSILEVNNLYFIESDKNNLIRIVTRDEYKDYAMSNMIKEMVFTIPNGKARTVARAVTPMLTKGLSRMLIDEQNNRIIVMDVPERLDKIIKVVTAFTSPPGQVLIECHIYEITLTDGYEFGVDWSAINLPNIVNTVRTSFIPRSQTEPNLPANQGLAIYRTDDLTDGGTIEGLIQAVANDVKIESIASPKILTQHNQKSEVYIGRQIPYNETIIQGLSGNQTSSFKFLDTGTKLVINPNITSENDIQLNLEIEVSSSPGMVSFGKDGALGQAPEKISTNLQTNLLVKNKGIVIIGGLIKKEDREEVKGIPILKDIPIIKYFFSFRTVSTTRTETVIFIQPTIINKDKYQKIPTRYENKLKQTQVK